jgi:hypothetical protein
MNEDQLLATADVESLDSALDGYSDNAAVMVHSDMLNRMMTHFPDIFSKTGEAILYRNRHPISVHNKEDGDIEIKEQM